MTTSSNNHKSDDLEMCLWSIVKDYLWSWRPSEKKVEKQENWAFHNEYLMKTFFPKYRGSGNSQGLIEDLKQVIERIDEKDCLYDKAGLIKDLRKAIEILAEN